jgi:hypothetical protein
MRTTLSLDDDLLPQVKTYAESRDITVGKAVSELVRRGLRAPIQTRVVNGFHVIELPPGSPPVTIEHIRKLEEELD